MVALNEYNVLARQTASGSGVVWPDSSVSTWHEQEMDHADIRARHNDLFRSSAAASHGQQSLSGSNIGTASSSWGGSTKTITGIKRNVAKDLLKSLDKGTDSDSSLSDIGKRSSTRIATSKSHATSTSQLGFFPRQDASTGFYESLYVAT